MFCCTVKNTLIIISVCTFCFGRDDFYIKKTKTIPKNPQVVFDFLT